MNTTTIVLLVALAAIACAMPQSGYGKQQSYGQVNYQVKYNIDLPKDSHGAAAQWQFQDDAKNAQYNLQQYHPYAAKSNVYYTQESYH